MSLLNFDALTLTGAYLFNWCSSIGTVQMGKLQGLGIADITDYVWDRSLPRRSAEIRPRFVDLGLLVWADTPSKHNAQRQWIPSLINLARQAHTEATRRKPIHRTLPKEGASSRRAKQFHSPALWLMWHQLERSTWSRPSALWRFCHWVPWDIACDHNTHPQFIILGSGSPASQSLKTLLPGIKSHFQSVPHVWHLKGPKNSQFRCDRKWIKSVVTSFSFLWIGNWWMWLTLELVNLSGPEIMVFHAPLP